MVSQSSTITFTGTTRRRERHLPRSRSGVSTCGLLEFRVVGHGVVDVHRKRILDVLRIDVGAEFVVDQLDHLVERVTLGRPDVVDALQFVIGCELAGANDVVDVREVPCLAPVAEQFRAVTVGDLVGELGDRVGELAFMFFGAAEAPDTPRRSAGRQESCRGSCGSTLRSAHVRA